MNNTGEDYEPRAANPAPANASQHEAQGRRSDGYPEGYLHGRAVENSIQRDREKTSLANGLILGIAVTGLLGLAVAAYFIFTPTADRDIIITPPVEAPESENELSEDAESGETTIIERSTEIIREPIPVPAPEQPQQAPPEVNVTVPPAQPNQSAPAVENNLEVQPSEAQPEASGETPEADAAPPSSATE